MRVERLKLANMRAITAADFRFQPGLNLIVGVNGVGKTSVLDAIGVCLSAVVKHVNKLRSRIQAFEPKDIRIGADVLDVECGIEIAGRGYSYLIHMPRETSSARESKAGMPREQVHDTPTRTGFIGEPPPIFAGGERGGRPLAILFSTNRAVPSERAPSKNVAAGGISAAFADAFANRELRLGEFAKWMRVQETLFSERPQSARVLTAFGDAVERFLPDYHGLRLNGERRPKLVIDRDDKTIPVAQLSDGERGNLALVLDLTRRLAQANPDLKDPAADAEAVVLIDEIDLHLHPRWQRQIVHNLTATFPRCQFIATTHSPQVIGEVEHERIQIIADGEVYSPRHSFGVDSSRVLEEVMDADERSEEVKKMISKISAAVRRHEFDTARGLLQKLAEKIGENDAEVTRARTLLDFMEGND